MSDWTAGYVAECGYTYGYYPELNPLATQLAFLNAGRPCPRVDTACELGFGQGISINVHAAASATHWYGNDFIPAQAAFAQKLAAISGAAAQLTDESFADFAQRDDLPDFDYIGMHGIWSWVSAANRAVLIDFIARKLKPGGVLYMSYNALPGWSAFAPMRHLMTEHARMAAATGAGIIPRIDDAVQFAEQLLATSPLYAQSNPGVLNHFKQVSGQQRSYLAHEYFNRDWAPMHFAEVAQCLAPAGLAFACSATYFEHIDALNMTTEQRAFLLQIEDANLRETTRDYMVNQRFRRDYWIKSSPKSTRLSPAEQRDAFDQQQVILLTPRDEVPPHIIGSRCGIDMDAEIYDPLLDALADHRPHSLGELAQNLQAQGVTPTQLRQAVIILSGMQQLASVQEAAITARARPHCDALNAWLIDQAPINNDIGQLLSPVTGGGKTVEHTHRLFLHALRQGHTEPAGWARSAAHILAAQAPDSGTAKSDLTELTRQAQSFADKQRPILSALQII
jgi:SAM-dependent methyltransferase